MDELDSRIRDALADPAATSQADRVWANVSARLANGRVRRRAPNLPRGVALAASLAIVIAVGATVVGRPGPTPPSPTQPTGSPSGGSATAVAVPVGPPQVSWASQPLDVEAVGKGMMTALAQGPGGLVAAGRLLDTSHHHNTPTAERHHVEAVVWTSPDGRGWRAIARQPGFEHATITSVASTHGIFLAVGNGADDDGGTSPRVWRSTDGNAWSLESIEGLPANAVIGPVTALPSDFLLVASTTGADGVQGGRFWHSADGVAWEPLVLTNYPAVAAWSVLDTGDGFVAIGQRARAGLVPLISRSTDGLTWEAVDVAEDAFGPDLVGIDDIVAGRPGFVAGGRVVDRISPQDPDILRLGPPTDGAIWTSPDLATWTRVEPGRQLFGGEDDQAVRLLERLDAGYAALGVWGTGGAGWVSADGTTWHRSADADGAFSHGAPDALLPVGNQLVAVGGDGEGGPAVWLGHVVAQELTHIEDFDDLVAAIERSGASVVVTEQFDPMPDVLGRDGRRLCVDGQRVDAYVFGSAAEAAALAATIDRDDPTHVGHGTIIEWAGDPRFWLAGTTLVLYLGPDRATEQRLTDVLGPPLAHGVGRVSEASRFQC